MKSVLRRIVSLAILFFTSIAITASFPSAQAAVIPVTTNSELNVQLKTKQQNFSKNTIIINPIKKGIVSARSGLNLRKGPGANYPIIKILPNGTIVNVLEEKNSWYRIDNTGWVRSIYIKQFQKQDEYKIAYLTFDDGPSSKNTPLILDILKKYKVKATFFVNGYGKKDIYKRIIDEGHVIGNHSYSHDYKTLYSSVGSFKKDVEKLNDYLEEITGKRPDILRFPGGSNNTVSRKYGGTKIMKVLCGVVQNDLGYQYFDWNVSSEDASKYRASKDFIVRSALNGAKNTSRAIVLLHDAAAKTTTVDALLEIIVGLVDMGFNFDVLSKDTPSVQFIKP